MTWTWEFYIDEKGSNVVDEVLKAHQPKHEAAQIYNLLTKHITPSEGIFTDRGPALHKIDEFWQLRKNQLRVLAIIHPSRKWHLVLLHAFIKKTQKTPPGEIEHARANWNNFLIQESKKNQS